VSKRVVPARDEVDRGRVLEATPDRVADRLGELGELGSRKKVRDNDVREVRIVGSNFSRNANSR